MKKFAIIKDGRVDHIFNPLKEFGIDENPYPKEINVVSITGNFIQIGDRYPPRKAISERLNTIYQTEYKRLYIEMTSKNITQKLSFNDVLNCVKIMPDLDRLTLVGMKFEQDWNNFFDFCNSLFLFYNSKLALKIPHGFTDFSVVPIELRDKVCLSFLHSYTGVNSDTFKILIDNLKKTTKLGFRYIGVDIILPWNLMQNIDSVQDMITLLEELAPLDIISIIVPIDNTPFEIKGSTLDERKNMFNEFKKKIRFNKSNYYGVFWMVDSVFDENVIGVNSEGKVYSNYGRLTHVNNHYSQFNLDKYKLIGKKSNELQLNHNSTDFTKLDEYIKNLPN